jgi:uncharacterized membrane protein
MLTQPFDAMKIPRATYQAILAGALIWCAAIILAPLLVTSPSPWAGIGELLYRFFHPICHQRGDRSFVLFGGQLAVCSRCASIYFSFLAGTLCYPVLRNIGEPRMPPRAVLALAIAPMVMDVAAGFFGVYPVTALSRVTTGSIFGVILPFFIIPGSIEAVCELAGSRSLPTHSIHQ